MSKNYLLAIIAGAALLAAGCNPTVNPGPDPSREPGNDPSENPSADPSGSPSDPSDNPGTTDDDKITSADLVGSWGSGEQTMLVFKEDGSYTDSRWGSTVSGTWSFNETDSILSYTPKDEETMTENVSMIGGKTWLIFSAEITEGESKSKSFESYRKIGAKVESGPLSDGRWDAPFKGVKPTEYAPDTDYRLCMIISGSTVDLYVPMWGKHVQGTFTFDNGRMHITTDDDHIWGGYLILATSYGWNAWGSPGEEWDDTWDDSYGAMNAETFELQSPYQWYSVNDILSRGKDPEKYKAEYNNDPFNIKWMLWGEGQSMRKECLNLCDFDLCVTDDGKEALGDAVGLGLWLYKR